MKGYIYSLRLMEPLLAGGLEGDPNTNRSLPFVPGSLVRGALIAAYLRREDSETLDATDPEERRLFLDGTTRYLHAYPQDPDRLRALPASRAWLTPKLDPDRVCDLSVSKADVDQPQRIGGYCTLAGKTISLVKYPYQVNVHTQRDAKLGRATEGRGAVFRYESLPAGLMLQGAILADTDQDLALLRELMEGSGHLLGGARTAGYGRARFEELAEIDDSWREAGFTGEIEPGQTYDHVIVRCLSEVLLRGPDGFNSLDLAAALGAQLGVAATPQEHQPGQAVVFAGSQVVGGFNRKWGLPLPQETALAGGSVFGLALDPPVKGGRLLALEAQGVGFRRAEGFGRLAFFATDELPAELTIQLADARMHIQPVKELSIHGQHLGELMLKRRMRADLETNLTKAVNTIDIRLSPSKSQLARWRVLGRSALMRVRSIAAEEDAGQPEAAINAEIERLQTFLQREQKRRSRAWQTFERARISRGGRTIRLAEWIEKMVSADEEMWNWMDQPTEYQLGERLSAAIDPDDAFEFRIRLMDAVMAKAARQTG